MRDELRGTDHMNGNVQPMHQRRANGVSRAVRVLLPFACACAALLPGASSAAAVASLPPTVPVGADPYGLAITPDGAFAYVANFGGDTVSVIDTTTNTVATTVPT
ncbi:YncE family protein, partial [Rhodococcus jostii]|uniref:YncE family protein n=1 Tax=Rhodococcus jostii TaxID=132919 RepID=UPI00363980F2